MALGQSAEIKALRALGCAAAKDAALIMPFHPGSNPREGKGCVQEEGRILTHRGLVLPQSTVSAPQTHTWEPALSLTFPVTLGKSILQSGVTETML